MTGKKIFEEMNYIEDDLLEEAVNAFSFTEKAAPIRITWKYWLIPAACLVLFVAITTIFLIGNMAVLPLSDDTLITANDVFSQSTGYITYGTATKAYSIMSAEDLTELMQSPIRDNTVISALKVYKGVKVRQPEALFKEKVSTIISNVKENLNTYLIQEEDPSDSLKKDRSIIKDIKFTKIPQNEYFYNSANLISENYRIDIDSSDFTGAFKTNYFIRAKEPIQPLKLFGEKITVEPSESDQSIENKLTEALVFANKVFGTDCEFQYTIRDLGYTEEGYATIIVKAFRNSNDMKEAMFNRYLSSLQFLFMNDGNDKELTLQHISYSEYEFENAFPEDTRLLSLREAKYYLKHGYIFTGQACPACMSRRADVDFSDYDGVEIVYRDDALGKYIIPFYAFYKKVDEHVYAVAYVPAVEVDDIKEYFKSQEAWHKSEKHLKE